MRATGALNRRAHMAALRATAPKRDAGPEAQTPVRQLFLDIGVPSQDLIRAEALAPEAFCVVRGGRARAVLEMLLEHGLSAADVSQVLLKWPQAFDYDVGRDIQPVLDFLRMDLGLTTHDIRKLLTAFPVVLSYNVKAHLRPQLAYLHSLGVGEEVLPKVVLQRPLLLGEGLDTLVQHLKRRGVPRTQMYRLLRSLPIDYCLQFKGVDENAYQRRS